MNNINNDIIISVVCPIYNEEKYINHFFNSILNQDYPKDKLEVLFIDGMSNDNTNQILSERINEYSFCKLLINEKRTVPFALNIGIENAKGNIIIRLDAHCNYPKNYISSLVYWLDMLKADNVGGVWKTKPSTSKASSISIAIASSSIFGVGNSHHKTGATQIIETDTVPFGCYNKSIFSNIGLFDEELTRNQDDELNGRIIKNGGKIYLIPEIEIEYFARENFNKMAKMYYQYGLFKPLVNLKLGRPMTIRQFIPIAFLFFLLFGGILSFFIYNIFVLFIVINTIYLFIGIIIGVKNAFKYKKAALIILLPIAFLIIHLSYGFGYLFGLFKIINLKNSQIKVETSR